MVWNNDLIVINSKNDILTILIHLGHLSFDRDTSTCRIPISRETNNTLFCQRFIQVMPPRSDFLYSESFRTFDSIDTHHNPFFVI